jgi:tyrosine-specific transport protein
MSKKLIGSTVIVAGMAVGAGMLAIPLATAQLGFMSSLLLMFACWVLMSVSALVLLEVTLNFDKSKNSFSQMAGSTLGKPGKIIMYISFLSFIYALISAYLTGGSSMITSLTEYLFDLHIPHEISGLLFLMLLGGFIYVSTGAVDRINRFLFSAQMLIFIVLLALFMPQIDLNFLTQSEHALWYLAAPVVLTSFGFHTVIPSLVTYMGDEAPKLKWALIFGSLVPLVCYAFWQAAILGTLPLQGENSFAALREANGSIGEMVVMVSHTVESSSLSTSLALFTNLALMTSFLGVSLSLFDFWNKNLSETKKLTYQKPLAFGLTFIPPFLFTLAFPQGFAQALAYGAVFEAILCILLPVAMAYTLRKQQTAMPFKVWGGTPTLSLLAISGLGMVGLDFFINNVI